MSQQEQGRCEVAECGVPLIGESFFDKYFKRRVCPACFENAFKESEQHGFGEWFEANYKKDSYPPEFWKKVGAFVDLSNAGKQDPYR